MDGNGSSDADGSNFSSIIIIINDNGSSDADASNFQILLFYAVELVE